MVIKKVIVISRIRIKRIIPQIIRIVLPAFFGRYPKNICQKNSLVLVKLQIEIIECEYFFQKITFIYSNIQQFLQPG